MAELVIDGELEEVGRRSANYSRSRDPEKVMVRSAPEAEDKLARLGIQNHQLKGLQEWVGRPVERNLPQGMVEVCVTHENLQQKMLALRFDLHMSIGDLKVRLHLHHGTPASSQRLVLRDGGVDLCCMDDDRRMLGFYSVQTGQTIHVFDTDPHSMSRGGGLENVDLVKKYRMTDDDYDKRKGTLREWIKDQKAKDPNWKPPKPNMMTQLGGQRMNQTTSTENDVPSLEDAEGINVGDRCEVAPGGRRGTIAYVGELDGAKGIWIGISLDEPLGKHNGSLKGKTYFQGCPDLHGTFARPKNVTVGHFPDLMDDDDDEL